MKAINTDNLSPFMTMIVAGLEQQSTVLTNKEQTEEFPVYERVLRLAIEVYKANRIPITFFEFRDVNGMYHLQINTESVLMRKEVING